MDPTTRPLTPILATLAFALFCGGLNVDAADPQWSVRDIEFFESRIRPVLVERCYRCHSQEAAEKNQLKGNLLVDSRAGLLTGGDSGAALVPGEPGKSLLLESLRYESYEMPPDGQLPQDTIADFARWIENGAADPRTGDAPPLERTIDLESGRQHWAYQPLPIPPVGPTSPAAATSRIDGFLNAQFSEAGLEPAAPADRRTLARRLFFDLTGLPPTPADIDRFVHDDSPEAYERLVDRLLASPHFGERWGRHWLDVARFAESVTLRGLVQQHAWRYRDYVIDAFNRDLPFDEFLREQIAGDLLEAESLEERQRQHIATGFLTFTDANLEDQDKEKLRMDVVDEQLSVIGKALLAQTIACARCHDHKFDPIPQTDYYALAGILRNTQSLEHANVSRWVDRPLPVLAEVEQAYQRHEELVAELEEQLETLEEGAKSRKILEPDSLAGVVLDDAQADYVGRWKRSTSIRPFVADGYRHDQNELRGEKSATFEVLLPESATYEVRLGYTPGSNRSSRVVVTVQAEDGPQSVTINQKKPPEHDGVFVSLGRFAFSREQPAVVTVSNRGADGHVVVDAVQFLPPGELSLAREEAPQKIERQQRQKIAALESELKRLKNEAPARPMYQGVREEAEIADMPLHIRGNVHSPGEEVPRGFLRVVSLESSPKIPANESGRRQLAEWLADPSNPLPARVFANRIWHWLFGAGLVRTPDNFGTMGESPSHPELLDYLAGRLVHSAWSPKALIREIVLSDAYRRSSSAMETNSRIDPENRLWWRMNRKPLEAECLLDAVLSVSGRLDRRVGGKTVPDSLSADYGFVHDSRRRAIYWPQFRNSRPKLLELFDGANPSLVTGRRNVSSVAPQALYLMNNPWILDRSRDTAQQLLDGDALSESARIQSAYLQILGRRPDDSEEQMIREFLSGGSPVGPENELDRWAQLIQSLFCSLDFRYLH